MIELMIRLAFLKINTLRLLVIYTSMRIILSLEKALSGMVRFFDVICILRIENLEDVKSAWVLRNLRIIEAKMIKKDLSTN